MDFLTLSQNDLISLPSQLDGDEAAESLYSSKWYILGNGTQLHNILSALRHKDREIDVTPEQSSALDEAEDAATQWYSRVRTSTSSTAAWIIVPPPTDKKE